MRTWRWCAHAAVACVAPMPSKQPAHTLQTNRWPSSPLSFHSRKWLLQIEIELILESNCVTVAESLLLKFEWALLRYCIHPPSDLSFFSSWTPAEWPCIMNHLHIHKPPWISRKGHYLQPPVKMFSVSSLIVFGQNLEGEKDKSQKVKVNTEPEVSLQLSARGHGVTSQRAVSLNLLFWLTRSECWSEPI